MRYVKPGQVVVAEVTELLDPPRRGHRQPEFGGLRISYPSVEPAQAYPLTAALLLGQRSHPEPKKGCGHRAYSGSSTVITVVRIRGPAAACRVPATRNAAPRLRCLCWRGLTRCFWPAAPNTHRNGTLPGLGMVSAPAQRPSRAGGEADIGVVGAVVADPTRARILLALEEGRALPASRLAAEAGVSAATASRHLRTLADAGLLVVEGYGRHRYYRRAGPDLGRLGEALQHRAPAAPVRSLREGTRAQALRRARSCYDHLVGHVGVALMAALLPRRVRAATSPRWRSGVGAAAATTRAGLDQAHSRCSRGADHRRGIRRPEHHLRHLAYPVMCRLPSSDR